MSTFPQQAEAQTKQIIGQMLGDGGPVEEAREQRQVSEDRPSDGGP